MKICIYLFQLGKQSVWTVHPQPNAESAPLIKDWLQMWQTIFGFVQNAQLQSQMFKSK